MCEYVWVLCVVCVCFTLLRSKYFSSLVFRPSSPVGIMIAYSMQKLLGRGKWSYFHAMSVPVLGPVQKTHCSFRTENDLHNSFPQFGTSLPLCLYYWCGSHYKIHTMPSLAILFPSVSLHSAAIINWMVAKTYEQGCYPVCINWHAFSCELINYIYTDNSCMCRYICMSYLSLFYGPLPAIAYTLEEGVRK